MARVTIKTKGTAELNDAQLENAASEETLAALLAAVSKLNNTLTGAKDQQKKADKSYESAQSAAADKTNKNARAMGGLEAQILSNSKSLSMFGDNASGSGTKLATLGKYAGMAGKAVAALSGAFLGIVGYLAGAVMDVFTDVVAASSAMFKKFMEGENRLSAFADAVVDATARIPLIGGIIAGLFGAVSAGIKVLEEYRDVNEQLSNTGAAFGKNLFTMTGAAKQADMTLADFASTVSANAEILSRFGTVATGALALASASKAVRQDFRIMGYSVKDLNDQLPTMLDLLAMGGQKINAGSASTKASLIALGKETSLMAILTGKNRKTLLEEQQKATTDVGYRLAVSKMSVEEQNKLNIAMISARAAHGDLGAEMIKLRVLGMPPMTEAQRNFVALNSQAADTLGNMVDYISQSGDAMTANSDKFQNKVSGMFIDSLEQSGNAAKNLEPILRAAAAGMTGTAGAAQELFQTSFPRLQAILKDQTLIDGKLSEQGKKQLKDEQAKMVASAKTADANAAAMADFEGTIADMRSSLFDSFIVPIMNTFKGPLKIFVDNFIKKAPEILAAFKPLGAVLADLAPKLADTANWIADHLVSVVEEMPKVLTKAGDFITAHYAQVETWFRYIYEHMASAFAAIIDPMWWSNLGDRISLIMEKAGLVIGHEIRKALPFVSNNDEEFRANMRSVEARQAAVEANAKVGTAVREGKKPEQMDLDAGYAGYTAEVGSKKGKDRQELEDLESQYRGDFKHGRIDQVKFDELLAGNKKQLAELDARPPMPYEQWAAIQLTANRQDQKLIDLTAEQIKIASEYHNIQDKSSVAATELKASLDELTKTISELKLKGTELLNDPEFKQKSAAMSERLGVDHQQLMGLMNVESSGLNPGAVNPVTKAVGLIQFMPKTAKELRTSTEALKNMSGVDQLTYVEKFLDPFLKKAKKDDKGKVLASDLYAAVFMPAAVGQDDSLVLGKKNSNDRSLVDRVSLGEIYSQNSGLDFDSNGKITKGELGNILTRERNKLFPDQSATEPTSRALGSYGMTGKLFEDFGAGTAITAHGSEAIVTQPPMATIVESSMSKITSTLIQSQTDGQNQMISLLNEMLSVLRRANRYQEQIAQNV